MSYDEDWNIYLDELDRACQRAMSADLEGLPQSQALKIKEYQISTGKQKEAMRSLAPLLQAGHKQIEDLMELFGEDSDLRDKAHDLLATMESHLDQQLQGAQLVYSLIDRTLKELGK